MSSMCKKIQNNIDDDIINKYYANMTPQMYKDGIQRAIKMTEDKLTEQYNLKLQQITEQYNNQIKDNILIAMDTIATEMIYELGNVLECYKDEPEYLDQKIDIVQGIYEKAMYSIENYASKKYKNDKQAQREFKRKQKIIKKIFGISPTK